MICEHCGEECDKTVDIDDGTGDKIAVCEICLMEIIGNKLVGEEYEPKVKDPFKGIDKRYIQ
jgi:hypothetical protein